MFLTCYIYYEHTSSCIKLFMSFFINISQSIIPTYTLRTIIFAQKVIDQSVKANTKVGANTQN